MAKDSAREEEEKGRRLRSSVTAACVDPLSADPLSGDPLSGDPHADAADEQTLLEPPGPSDIARSLGRLRSATFDAVAKRERLPRTLFWSLFRTEIDAIKKKKEKRRLLRCLSELP